MANIVNRYKQLLAGVPRGSFYAADGQVVPFRSSPYSLRIATNTINGQIGLFINNQFMGSIVTDANGMAIVVATLQKGRNDIQLIDPVTQQATSLYLTTRDSATWMASEAQTIEDIDQGIEQVLLDARLATSSVSLIETVFGQTVGTGNSFGYDLETYRGLLQELRTAYRYFGASDEGISRAVRAFTQISPLIYPRAFGPRWILGKDIISPKQDTSARTYFTTSPLTNINAGGANVSITSIGSDVGVGSALLTYHHSASPPHSLFNWQPPNGSSGIDVPVVSGINDYTLYGLDYFDPIISLPEPYVITTGLNDQMSIEVDGKGIVQFTLPVGVAVTAASIVTQINSALNGDIRYGVAYNSVASVYNAFGGANMIALTTPNASSGGSVTLHVSPNNDGVQTIFDIPTRRGGFSSVVGGTVIQCTANTDMSRFPTTASTDNPFSILIGYARYNPAAPAAPSALTSIGQSEMAQVVGVDFVSKRLTLAASLLYAHNGDLISVDGELAYKRNNVQNSRSISIHIGNQAGLLGANTTDTITVSGSGAPDGWVITDNAGGAVSSLPFQKHIYFETDRDLPFDINNNGMVSIPVPNEILNYRGFPLTVEVWGRVDDPSRATTQENINTIGVSYDNQSTYTYFTPQITGVNVNTTWEPQLYLVQTTVNPSATKVWIQIKTNGGSNGNFTIHKVRVNVLGHDGLFLGSGTTPRNEAKIKQGAFLYVWSPNQLTANEALSLGTSTETNVSPGHIDTIAPAQAWLDKFDVSTYDINGNPTNIFGVFTDGDFLNGQVDNLNLNLGTPPRFSYLSPSVISVQTDTITWPAIGPFVGVLSLDSNQNQANAYLLEDGIPVTQDNWSFISPNQIQLNYTPTGSVYTFTYSPLIQFQSAVVDLGVNYANYLWFADYHIFLRPEIVPSLTSASSGIQFNQSGIATLAERSNGDQTTATLIENTGLSTRIIPSNQWSFIDNQTVQISLNVLNFGSLYQLNYVVEANHPGVKASALVEARSGTTAGAAEIATYSTVLQNQPVTNANRYWQFRVTLNNIRDIRDAKIQSVLLKGLNMFGVGGTVPVLRPG